MRSAIFVLCLIVLFAAPNVYGDLDSGLVAEYSLDGNVNDLSSNNYHGIAIGNPTYSSNRIDKPNSSIILNGLNQCVKLPVALPTANGFSLSFWIKTSANNPNNWPQAIYLFDRDNCATDYDWNISLGLGGKIIFASGIPEPLGGGTHKLVSDIDINDNNWHHIVVLIELYSTNKSIYIDGELNVVADFAPTWPFLNQNIEVFIGASDCDYNGRQKFQGGLDDIRFYNRRLTDSEVMHLYRGETSYIRFIPQGLYNPQTKMLNRSDSITIYARNYRAPWGYPEYELFETLRTVIDSVTFVAPFQSQYNYWGAITLEVRHWGSISTWSVLDYQFFDNYIRDFTTTDVSVMVNEIQVDSDPPRYAAFSGDVNKDDFIDATDVAMIENERRSERPVKRVLDINGDDVIDDNDIAIVEANALLMIEMKYYKEAARIKYP